MNYWWIKSYRKYRYIDSIFDISYRIDIITLISKFSTYHCTFKWASHASNIYLQITTRQM